ncbi:unnamed protein product, partial [marine sediment metagenome]
THLIFLDLSHLLKILMQIPSSAAATPIEYMNCEKIKENINN